MKEPRREPEYPDYPESYHRFVAQGYEDDVPSRVRNLLPEMW